MESKVDTRMAEDKVMGNATILSQALAAPLHVL